MANKNEKNLKKTSEKKEKQRDVALDKFDVDVTATSSKKSSKTPQKKKKNPFKRFFEFIIPQPGDTKGEIARKVLLLLAICILIGTLVFLIRQLVGMSNTGKESDKLASSAGVPNSSINYIEPDRLTNPDAFIPTTAGTEEPEYIDLTPVVNYPLNVDFDYLRGINPDTRAWIQISGTLLNHAVVQRKGDFQYYVDHNFEGEYEEFSSEVFSGPNNAWDGTDDNIILYGHNLSSGYGFAYVNHYVPYDASIEPLAFYKVHPTILFQQDGGQSETYKIFAGIVVNTEEKYGEVFDYTSKTKFNSAEEFNDYIIQVMDRSWFYTDVDLEYGDKLLTLSTCYWPLGRDKETRFVLLARKVRPGESEYVDTSVAQRNYGAKLWDYYYQLIGGQWYGSNWDTSKLRGYGG